MKNLILVRHAKANIFAPDGKSDFYRELSDKGMEEAERISDNLIGKLPPAEIFLLSPATRTLQTFEIFKKKISYTFSVQEEKIFYASEAKDILEFIKGIPNDVETVWLFGHEPKLTEIIMSLSLSFDKAMSTCSIAFLIFDTISWLDIGIKNLVDLQHYAPTDFE